MTGQTPFQLILLPGLGADQRQFGPQRAAFPDLVVPPWIVPNRKETLPDYAARLAETIVCQRPAVLGGSSFGGMVAWEMARYLKPDVVVLLGSCRCPKHLHPIARGLRPMIPWTAVQAFDLAKAISPLALRLYSPFNRQQRRLCADMFKGIDSGLMKWASRAILDWVPGEPPPVPVRQIHGDKDSVIPLRLVEADEVIPGGGHLINLTHPDQVNAFITRAFESVR